MSRHLEIPKGRTTELLFTWLAPEADGQDLTLATSITFGLRRNVEDSGLAFSKVCTAADTLAAALTITAAEADSLALGRYASWGVRANFADGSVYAIDSGTAIVTLTSP